MHRNLNIVEKSLLATTTARDRLENADLVDFDTGMQPPDSLTEHESMVWHLLVDHARKLGLISAISYPAITLMSIAYAGMIERSQDGTLLIPDVYGVDNMMHGFGIDPGGAANMLADAQGSILDG